MKKYILLWWLALLPVTLIAAQTEEPLPLDASIASFSRAFTISYPSMLVEAYATPRSPYNVTLTNKADIFTADKLELSAGDVLITADYGTPASLVLPADGDAYSLAKDYYEVTTEIKGELLPVEVGEFTGYKFTSHYEGETGSFYFWRIFLNAAPEQLVWFTLVTPSQAEQDRLATTFNAIVTSLRLGARAREYSKVFEGANSFIMPYSEGWQVTKLETGIIMVTRRDELDADAALSTDYSVAMITSDRPVAMITFRTISEVTGEERLQSDPRDGAALIIETLLGKPDEQIRRMTINGYPAAMTFTGTPEENTVIVILRDENNFILTSIFTATGEDQDFPAIIVDMLLQATWDGVEAAPTP